MTLCTKSLRALYPLQESPCHGWQDSRSQKLWRPLHWYGPLDGVKFTDIPEDRVKRTVAAVGTRVTFIGQVERWHKWGTNGRVTLTPERASEV